MYKVIIICGKAGSGKDTLLKKTDANYHRVVSTTTRPPREGEINGIDYNFITLEDFHKEDFLEFSEFNGWYYGTRLKDFRKDKINILVANPDGIRTLLLREDFKVRIYYLVASDKTRLLRQLNREKEPDIHEIIRRFQADEKEFNPFLYINNWIEQSIILINDDGIDNSTHIRFD